MSLCLPICGKKAEIGGWVKESAKVDERLRNVIRQYLFVMGVCNLITFHCANILIKAGDEWHTEPL